MKDCILTSTLKFLAFKMCLTFGYSKSAPFLAHLKKNRNIDPYGKVTQSLVQDGGERFRYLLLFPISRIIQTFIAQRGNTVKDTLTYQTLTSSTEAEE